MTAARLTRAEARRLGLDGKGAPLPSPRRSPRRRPAEPKDYRTVCKDCALVFTSIAAEDRHVDETRHCRFDWVMVRA